MGRLKGKVAIITGAGAGIGRASMERFAEEGALVVGIGRTYEKLEQTKAQLQDKGRKCHIVGGDVSSWEGASEAFSAAFEVHGRVDVLLNGAGVGYSWAKVSPGSMSNVVDTPVDKWREVMAINLDSVFYMCKLAIPKMLATGGGSIINISSILAVKGLADGHTYCATKAGVENLTRSLCMAWAAQGIRANCVAPGWTATDMIKDVMHKFDDPEAAKALSPMLRPGTALEIANGCLYLASDESSYCNGSVLRIDGGNTAG
ncbi:SDR family NAD(P)-dependent oxidoreductase [Mesorhizobium sp. LjRoot246]|uniref:SDR family NAD(P)-dependent oxidoreductase n=1 Tax=Mesorhizobium sp. LjRoot246 TaxID=3342294 RepID=UPI003ECE2491